MTREYYFNPKYFCSGSRKYIYTSPRALSLDKCMRYWVGELDNYNILYAVYNKIILIKFK